MTIVLYGLKNCDACRRACKELERGGRPISFVDIRDEADLKSKVPHWLSAAGAARLINKRSTTWRSLSDAEQSRAEAGDVSLLLIQNPTLIKRPVMEVGDDVLVGWGPNEVRTLLGH